MRMRARLACVFGIKTRCENDARKQAKRESRRRCGCDADADADAVAKADAMPMRMRCGCDADAVARFHIYHYAVFA